ncbi:MAG: sugar ABC transporter substrate-binding protein [Candidatus Bathyarchaeia archaeon]
MYAEKKIKYDYKKRRLLTRRDALSTAGKVAIGVIASGIVAGISGYYAGSSAVPATITTTKTVTETKVVGAGEVVTETKTQTLTSTVTETITKTVGATTAPEVKELSIITVDFPGIRWLEQAIKRYKELSGVSVVLDKVTWDALHEKMVVALSARQGIYDAYGIPVDWFMEWLSNDWCIPLNTYIDNDLNAPPLLDVYDVALKSFSYNGKLYGIPWFIAAMMGYYRRDLFEKAGLKLPKTLDELVEVAIKLNNPPEVYGLALPGKQSEHTVEEWIQLLWSFGGEFVEDGKAAFNDEAGLKALQFMLDLIYKYKVVPPGFAQYSYDELATLFCEGKVAIYFGWPYTVAVISDPTRSKVADKWGIFPRPGAAWAGAWGWLIPPYSNKKDASYNFIKYILSDWVQRLHAENGEVVVRRSVLELPEIQEKQPVIKVMAEALPKAHSPPKIVNFAEVFAICAEELSKALLKQKSPEEALRDMEARVNAVIKVP